MTVPYTQSVSTARIGGFFRLLFRWRGSIYQVIYGETIIFIILYYALNLSYRWGMKETKWQIGFETFAKYCEGFADFIPVTFVLGFYVIHACGRRWTQWENLPWPDKFAFDISGHMVGSDQKTLMLRRTLIRYANLASVLCYRDISIAVRKRLPTLKHAVEAGLMNEAELESFKKTSSGKDSNWWIPFHWAYNLIYRAKIEGKLPEGSANKLQDDVLDLRQKCWVLFGHVATLAVYLFMLASLFGRQYVKKEGANHVDLFVPVFPFLQVMFYLGWLKVGEVLTNPFGGDADDFEMNYIIDRNLRISYSIVDEHYNTVPPIEKDAFWNTEPEMPHTLESSGLRTDGFIGSAASLDKPDQPPPRTPDAHHTEGGVISRSNSMRSVMRSGRQAFARPLSRLISRTSDRDRSDYRLIEAEKGEHAASATPPGSAHGTPTTSPQVVRRQREINLPNSQPSRLPSIVEGSENASALLIDENEEDEIDGRRKTDRVPLLTSSVRNPTSSITLVDLGAASSQKAAELEFPRSSSSSSFVPNISIEKPSATTSLDVFDNVKEELETGEGDSEKKRRAYQRRRRGVSYSLPDISPTLQAPLSSSSVSAAPPSRVHQTDQHRRSMI